MDVMRGLESASEHLKAGRLEQAEQVCRQVLEMAPAHSGALSLLGDALSQLGRLEEAESTYRRALGSQPDCAEFYNDLANVLARSGKVAEAERSYRRGISLNPTSPILRYNVGRLLSDLGRIDEAEECFREAAALLPELAEASFHLGNLLKRRGRSSEAAASYSRAVAIKPDYVEAHNNRGIVLADLGRFVEAERSYRQALACRPGHALAHNNLGNLLREAGHHEEAERCYRRTIELSPNLAEAHDHLGNALLDLARLGEAEQSHRNAVALAPAQAGIRSNLLLTLNYLPGLTPDQIVAEHREFKSIFPPASTQSHPNSTDTGRRLQVGYVSGDFRVHSVASFIEPVLACHDHRAFEVFCYYNFPRADAVTLRLKAHADYWRDVRALEDEALVRQVRADAIDILVDLSGHTGNNRLALFAAKAAPVQVAYLGYAATTGLTTVDWRITDPIADPEGAERWYSERLFRLPHAMWCFQPDDKLPAVTPSPALAGSGVTFGSFNYFAKLNTEVIATWAKLLVRLPQARLVVTRVPGEETARKLLERFAREDVAAERIELHGILPRPALGELLGRVDIALDTFPYAGTTTTCDMLWMGIPVVTLTSATSASRSGASLLHAVGLDELVAGSTKQYLDIAESLAGDTRRLAELRAGLRQRMRASRLVNATEFTRNLESAYRTMWRRWCGAKN
jgi:predicted O-linked N-acetylglucosamine transferase (SPINDLY family)